LIFRNPREYSVAVLKHALGLLLVAVTLTALPVPAFFAQSKEKKRPKLKDFGSTLRRFEWDPVKKQAIETKPQKKSPAPVPEDTVQIDTNLVSSDVLVVDDKGNLVGNLTAGDFLITEDDQPQEVAHFRSENNAAVPRTIVLIVDYSCAQLPVLRTSINAAKLLVDKLGPADVMAIVTDDVELLIDFTNDKDKLKQKLESIYDRINAPFASLDRAVVERRQPKGTGLQYSALLSVLNEAFSETDLRPIIIFQTSGSEIYNLRDSIFTEALPPDLPDEFRSELLKIMDRQEKHHREQRISDFSLKDVYRTVEKSRATIYTVVPEPRFLNRSLDEQVELTRRELATGFAFAQSRPDQLTGRARATRGWMEKRELAREEAWRPASVPNLRWWSQQQQKVQAALAGVAPRTGGWTDFLERPDDADGIYNRILDDINHRYSVGYYPKNKLQDGTRRKIKFSVRNHPDYYILARTSYYAPELK